MTIAPDNLASRKTLLLWSGIDTTIPFACQTALVEIAILPKPTADFVRTTSLNF